MERHPIRCSNCGGPDSVPFKPRPGGAPLLCGLCFKAKRVPDALPPMPSDPRYCRWCNNRRRMSEVSEAPEAWPCPLGCAPNNEAPYQRRCGEDGCRTEFRTGSRDQDLCWFHHRRELRELATLGQDVAWPNRPGTYTGDMNRRRVNTRAYLLLLEQREAAGELNESERYHLARLRERMNHARRA